MSRYWLRNDADYRLGHRVRVAAWLGARPLSWLEPKLRFEINRSAAERIGLRIGAKILNLAQLVDGNDQWE